MPEIKFLRRGEVESVTGLSRTHIYDLMDKGKFPKPVRIGQRAVAWVLEEITEWQRDRITDRDKEDTIENLTPAA